MTRELTLLSVKPVFTAVQVPPELVDLKTPPVNVPA
jgi:hypothetical protein